jgi:hypothetical protein
MMDSQAIFMRKWGIEPNSEMDSLVSKIRHKKPSLALSQVKLLAAKGFQKHIYTKIKPRALVVDHLGDRLRTIHPLEYLVSRWRQYFWKDHPALARSKLNAWWTNVRRLCKEVPPRVHFACILLGHHGWPTARRCGRGRHLPCPLCVTGTDDAYHLVRCTVVQAAFSTVFGEGMHVNRVVDSLLLSADLSADARIGSALLCHGIYTVCNMTRHSGSKSSHAASLIVDHAHAAALAHKTAFTSWLRLCKGRPRRDTVVAFIDEEIV